jgi:hypothetical protein
MFQGLHQDAGHASDGDEPSEKEIWEKKRKLARKLRKKLKGIEEIESSEKKYLSMSLNDEQRKKLSSKAEVEQELKELEQTISEYDDVRQERRRQEDEEVEKVDRVLEASHTHHTTRELHTNWVLVFLRPSKYIFLAGIW